MRPLWENLELSGHGLLEDAADGEVIEAFRAEAARLVASVPDQAHGIRQLLQRSHLLTEWALSPEVLKWLPPGFRPVRSILFDKVPGANWKVAWHQDLTITVKERRNLPGHGPWSVKNGVVHVQPPMSLLDSMITLRLHLDDTPAENGALKVILGSHRYGRLDAGAISGLRSAHPEHICEAKAGDILFMKPLLLHASSASTRPGHRRVVHVEYAPVDLLHPSLEWAEN